MAIRNGTLSTKAETIIEMPIRVTNVTSRLSPEIILIPSASCISVPWALRLPTRMKTQIRKAVVGQSSSLTNFHPAVRCQMTSQPSEITAKIMHVRPAYSPNFRSKNVGRARARMRPTII